MTAAGDRPLSFATAVGAVDTSSLAIEYRRTRGRGGHVRTADVANRSLHRNAMSLRCCRRIHLRR